MSIYNVSDSLLCEEKNVPIYINQIQYHVSSRFSLRYEEIYIKSLSDSNDSKKAIAAVIYEKLKSSGYDNITIEDIQKEKDDSFLDFINSILNENPPLNEIYSKEDESSPILQRFSISYSKYRNQIFAEMSSLALQLFQPLQSHQLFQPLQPHQLFQPLQPHQLFQPLQPHQLFQPLQSLLAKSIKAAFSPLKDYINNYSSIITKMLSSFKIPAISEEQNKEIIESYEKWGGYGWTCLQDAHFELFCTCPTTCLEADKIALAYCKDSHMKNLFNELRTKKVKKSDLEEAVFCFKNRQYKACSLVLFGIIDSKLIKLQPKSTSENRKVGFGAIQKYKKQVESEIDVEKMFILTFQHFNLLQCLRTLFNNTNDFKTESCVVNRNLVGHGMNQRKVRKKDCIKLFLAIYNLSDFLECINKL